MVDWKIADEHSNDKDREQSDVLFSERSHLHEITNAPDVDLDRVVQSSVLVEVMDKESLAVVPLLDPWPKLMWLTRSLEKTVGVPDSLPVEYWSATRMGQSIQISQTLPVIWDSSWTTVTTMIASLGKEQFTFEPKTASAPPYLRLKKEHVLTYTSQSVPWWPWDSSIQYFLDIRLDPLSDVYPDDYRWTLVVSVATPDRLSPPSPSPSLNTPDPQNPETQEIVPFSMEHVIFKKPTLTCRQRHINATCGHSAELGNRTMATKNLNDAIGDRGRWAIVFYTTSSVVEWLPGVTKLPPQPGSSPNSLPVYEVHVPLSKPVVPPHKLTHVGGVHTYTFPARDWKPTISISFSNIGWEQGVVGPQWEDIRHIESRISFGSSPTPQWQEHQERLNQLLAWTIPLRSNHFALLDEYDKPLYLTHIKRNIPGETVLVMNTSWDGKKLQIVHDSRWIIYAELPIDILATSKPVAGPRPNTLQYTLTVPALQNNTFSWMVNLVVDDNNNRRDVVVWELTVTQKDPDYQDFILTEEIKKKFAAFKKYMNDIKDKVWRPTDDEPDMPYISETVVPVKGWLYAKPKVQTETWTTMDIIGYDFRPVPLDPATRQDVDGLVITQSITNGMKFLIKKEGNILSLAEFTLDGKYSLNQEITLGSWDKVRRVKPFQIYPWIIWFEVAPPPSLMEPTDLPSIDVYDAARFRYPISTNVSWHATITSVTWLRRHPRTKEMKQHHGVDIAIPQWTPLYSVAAWRVLLAEQNAKWYWWLVVIEHNITVNGEEKLIWSVYGHLSQVDTALKGKTISKGALLWKSGGAEWTPWAGVSTWPHLHFETWTHGVISAERMRDLIVHQKLKSREVFQNSRLDPLIFFPQINFVYSQQCSNCPKRSAGGLSTVSSPPDIPSSNNVYYPPHFERDRATKKGWQAIQLWVYPKNYDAKAYRSDLQRHESVAWSMQKIVLVPAQNSQYIETFKSKTKAFMSNISQKTWVPVSLLYTIAIVETHAWATGIAPSTNNLYNIRPGGSWLGPYYQSPSLPKSRYRAYVAWEHSVMDFATLMNSPRYKATVLKSWLSLQQRIQAMINAWYATDPNYVVKAMEVANQYGLDTTQSPPPPPPGPKPPPPPAPKPQWTVTQQEKDKIKQTSATEKVAWITGLVLKLWNDSRNIVSYIRGVGSGRYGDPYSWWRLMHTSSWWTTALHILSPQNDLIHLDFTRFTLQKQGAGNLFVGSTQNIVFPNKTPNPTISLTLDASGGLKITIK
jgi:murein DD-endopeptidase MepM/ murein hydrolase activator NlpD/flagellum-specific peptidoglycan hydrolase FlgJ